MSNSIKADEMKFNWIKKLKGLIQKTGSGAEFTAKSLTEELLKDSPVAGNATRVATERFLKQQEDKLVIKNQNGTYSKKTQMVQSSLLL